MANSTKAKAIKAALYTRLQSLFPLPVYVSYGFPTNLDDADDQIWVGALNASNDLATMGTPRSREEVVTIEVVISTWSGGLSQQVVTERAYDYLATLDNNLQITDTTLDGVVRTSRIVSHELTETDAEDSLTEGRVAQINALIECKVRLT